MEFTIPEGTENKLELIVGDDNTAIAYGSGLLPVFATPAMLALMEETSHRSIEKFLPKGFTSVGTKATINHVKATLPSMKVVCHSRLTNVDGKRLTFELEAFDESGKIGDGTHERFIVESERFMNKIKTK